MIDRNSWPMCLGRFIRKKRQEEFLSQPNPADKEDGIMNLPPPPRLLWTREFWIDGLLKTENGKMASLQQNPRRGMRLDQVGGNASCSFFLIAAFPVFLFAKLGQRHHKVLAQGGAHGLAGGGNPHGPDFPTHGLLGG